MTKTISGERRHRANPARRARAGLPYRRGQRPGRLRHYYRALESAQKGTLDVTDWLVWFVGCFERAVSSAANPINRMVAKAARWEQFNAKFEANERQGKVINALLDSGKMEFSSSKYAKLAGTSLDTALRDITRMVQAGALTPSDSGGRSRKCTLGFAAA